MRETACIRADMHVHAGNLVNEMAVEMRAIAIEEMDKEEVKCAGGVSLAVSAF